MADVNFSQLTSASAVGANDQLLIRRNNALSGSAGFARATTAIVERGLGVYSTVQSNSAGWTQTLAFNSSNAQLTISNGNTISLSALSASSSGTPATYIRTTLANGANTIASPSGTPADGDVRVYHMKQPASGVGTITWNAIFLFPTGYVANLSTTANYVDLFEFTYDSTASKWRATRMIGGYAS
jgi:hypothetical protein